METADLEEKREQNAINKIAGIIITILYKNNNNTKCCNYIK